MDDWNNIRVLLAVVETGSIGAASRALGVSAATVSRRLAAAEDAIGQVLVERGPGGLRVTEAARAMVGPLREAELAVARAVQLSRSLAEDTGGIVRVAALPAIASDVICPALPRLTAAHPEIRVELLLGHQVANLGRGDADIAVRSARPEQQNLVARKLATIPMRPLAATSLIERFGADLPSLPWIAWPAGMNIGEVRWFEANVPNAQIVLTVDDIHAQIRACEAGVGAALLAEPISRLYHGLVPVPGAPEGYHHAVWLAATESARVIPRVDTVWRFLVSTLTDVFEMTSTE